jgi:hypothetical protein
MRSSDRRTPVARQLVEDEPSLVPVGVGVPSYDTIPAPPESDSHPGPLEDALDRAIDTIPTPPPESGIVENVVIPPLRPVDSPDEQG